MKSATALLLLCGVAIAQRPPLVPAGETRKLTPHVWAIEDKDTIGGVPNVGFVVGSKGVLVIDTGMGTKNGATVLAEAKKVAPGKKLYLVTTHVHPEHDLGAGAFPPDTTMIRSKDEEKDIEKNGMTVTNGFMSRNEVNKELLTGATFRKADVTFDRDYTLDLGGVSAKIIAVGPNHTLGDTVIFVPSDKVLFSGDVAMKGLPAFIPPDSSLQHWLIALKVLESLHPAVVVPSHGPIGDAAYITTYQTLLTTVRDRVTALKKQGKTLNETTTTVVAELAPQYKDANRIKGAVQFAYAEAP
jgi:glyoxylase-like metal-dependent hydrolase (beta-lactamase superfamily II)